MLRNDSPRISNKMYEIIKEIITNKISLNKFSKEFLEMLYTSEESHVYFNTNNNCIIKKTYSLITKYRLITYNLNRLPI